MADATYSNAGDRYHFVYVASQMLAMVRPGSHLTLIHMENLSPTDQALAEDADALLGVDVTLYFGGDNFASSSSTEITQVKYSSTSPNTSWTLNRLSRNKGSQTDRQLPGTSVIKKLAGAFAVGYGVLGEASRKRIIIRLLTNQPLQLELQEELNQIKESLTEAGDISDDDLGLIVKNKADSGNSILVELQATTELSWQCLAVFLVCWDLSAFGQPLAMSQEAEFAQLLAQYVDAGMYFGNLINFVQECALPNRPTDIRKDKVYGLLRIQESSFFPAPPKLANPNTLQVTTNVDKLLGAILNSPYPVVIAHGLSGSGKSSTIQLIHQHHAIENAIIIYDCFGGGQGIGLGVGRFPFRTFFVQVINDLATQFQTNIYATTALVDEEIIQRFNLALEKSAELARQAGQRLIIAVDAVDDAVEAAQDQPNRQDTSFVPYLWRVRWPANSCLVATCRTENKASLSIKCPYTEIVIEGFSQSESLAYLRKAWPDANDNLLIFAHSRTNGNPRVLAKLVETAQHDVPDDLNTFIDEQARESAFAYYRIKVPTVLGNHQGDWLLLATLRETLQSISLDDLAEILERPLEEVKIVIGRLYFGLRITEQGSVYWPDKDFKSYALQFTESHKNQARQHLANYCLREFEKSAYARINFSRHLFLAKHYRELIDWWMQSDRLTQRILVSQPNSEDAFDDVQFTLLAAIELQEFRTALQVLILAAEIAYGLDVFSETVRRYPRIVVEQNYAGRLLDYVRHHDRDEELMPTLFALARLLQGSAGQQDLAEQIFIEARQTADKIRRNLEDHMTWSTETVMHIALYKTYKTGLQAGLIELTHWKPEDQMAPHYMDLVYTWCRANSAQDAIESIEQQSLSAQQITYALMGVLGAGSIEKETALKIATAILDRLRAGEIKQFGRYVEYGEKPLVGPTQLLDNLIRLDLNQIAVECFRYWSPDPPNSDYSVTVPFAQHLAYKHFLGATPFDLAAFSLGQLDREGQPLSDSKRQERQQEDQRSREKLQLLFPPQLIRLRSLSGANLEEITSSVEAFLAEWQGKTAPYWYQFFSTDVVATFGVLIEAIVNLPGYFPHIISRIVSLTEELLNAPAHFGFARYADTLSRVQDYHVDAEHLIYRRLEAIRIPDYSASEAIESLLDLYPAAARVDPQLGLQIFLRARLEAGSWDRHTEGLAYALLSSLQHSQPVGKLSVAHLNELVSIFQIIKKVTTGFDVELHLDWFVRLLLTINPEFSLPALFEFDKVNFLELDDSITGLAFGLLDAQLPAQSIYPLAHIASGAIQVFEESIRNLSGNAQDIVLGRLNDYIHKEIARDRQYYHANQVLLWAEGQGLSTSPAIAKTKDFVAKLKQLKVEGTAETQHLHDDRDPKDDFLAQIETTLNASPVAALQLLLEADQAALMFVKFDRFCNVITDLTDRLPARHISDILRIVERYSLHSYEAEVLSLISIVAKHSRPSEAAYAECIETLQRILTPAHLDRMTRWWGQKHLDALLDCQVLEAQVKLSAFLHATSTSLSHLYANELYRAIGAYTRLLPREDALAVYQVLHKRAASKLPAPAAGAINPYPSDALYRLYLQFLSNCLGHPDQSICLSVLFTLIEISINLPAETLPLLISALDDKTHPRWLSKRVWLLILFHHLSLRAPKLLEPYISSFVPITLSTEFPHAKMRFHAQQVLLNIESASPDLLEKSILSLVQAANQPKSVIKKEHTTRSWEGHHDNANEGGWSFDWETTRYWYRSIEDLFGGDRTSVRSIARKWIVDKLGLSNAEAQRTIDWVHSRYDYHDTNNSQGSLPRVESLKMYAELHARYLAAGELADTAPGYWDEWSGHSEWADYVRYHVQGLDALLPVRCARSIPLTTANYGVFDTSFETWVRKDDDSEFEKELWADDQQEYVVIAGGCDGNGYDRRFSVTVDSYLIDPSTSAAFARLLNSQDDFVDVPNAYSPYDSTVPELMSRLAVSDGQSAFSLEINEPPFILHGWIVFWHQEMPMQSLDFQRERLDIALEVFAPSIVSQHHIRFDPTTLNWTHAAHGQIARSEFWRHQEGRKPNETITSGRRLVIQHDFLLDLLRKDKMDLVVVVRLQRSRPYNSGYKNGETFDKGALRAFVLTGDAKVRLDMNQKLINQAQVLINELNVEGATTLQKWMAHYLAEQLKIEAATNTTPNAQDAKNSNAELIAKLWRIRADEQATHLQQRLWNVNRLPSEDSDYTALKSALHTPPADALPVETWADIYSQIIDIEYWLAHLVRIASKVGEDTDSGATDIYLSREKAGALSGKLADVFSELESIDLNDRDNVYAWATDAMNRLYNLRFRLLQLRGNALTEDSELDSSSDS